jgi:hypothetical protein
VLPPLAAVSLSLTPAVAQSLAPAATQPALVPGGDVAVLDTFTAGSGFSY